MSTDAQHNNTAAPPPDIDFERDHHDEFDDDAPLNPDFLDAQTINWIIAQLTNPDVNILDVASELNCSPASLLEIITHAAEFRSHVDAMRDLALLSAQIIASASLPRHTDTLNRIADDESVHPETRRKAIGALIRLARGMSLPRATSHTNGVAGARSSSSASSSGATGSLSARVFHSSGATGRAQRDPCTNSHSHSESCEPQAQARGQSESPVAPCDTQPNPDSGFPDAASEHLEHSSPPLQQYVDELLTLDDEALFAEARAAAQSLIDLGIIPRTSIRAGPAGAE